MTNQQLAKHAANIDRVSTQNIVYVQLPNLLTMNIPAQPTEPKQIIIAVCGDCQSKQVEKNQFCQCGAMLYPF